jgi:hypothetical protein
MSVVFYCYILIAFLLYNIRWLFFGFCYLFFFFFFCVVGVGGVLGKCKYRTSQVMLKICYFFLLFVLNKLHCTFVNLHCTSSCILLSQQPEGLNLHKFMVLNLMAGLML